MIEQYRSYTMILFLLALLVGVSALGAQTSDASEPPQFISEVLPIKYARAADVAATLIRMTTNSVSAITEANNPSAVLSPGTPASPAGQLRIIADERTNSLLIYATPEDMQRIKESISRLDHVLPQLLIEAVIMSVSLKDSESSSPSFFDGQAQGPANYSLGAGALSGSNLLSVTRFVPIVQTNAARSQLGGFEYLAKLGSDLDVLEPALADDSRVRILQRPRIQTSDGETATIFVGEVRPYPTNAYYGRGACTGPSSISQIQTGVTIEVTPFVKPDGFVEMDIHQKIDRPAGSVTITNVGDVPITSSTEAQAKVVVRDRETILLGGWIETVNNRTPSGVPLLKDIPVLGALFRGSSAPTPRNELIVLIRPTVLPPPTEKNKMPAVRAPERELLDVEKQTPESN